MKASASIIASTQQQARERAEFAFRDFYGDQPYRITEESAESHTETMAGQIETWRCEITAELDLPDPEFETRKGQPSVVSDRRLR